MSYFTTDVFETKREILTFADKVARAFLVLYTSSFMI